MLPEGMADTLDSGTLLCSNPACRAAYPVIDGIPVIVPNVPQLLSDRAIELLLRDDLDWDVLGHALGPDSWLDALRQTRSTYGWDAYADLDPGEPAGSDPGAARRCRAALLGLAPAGPVTRALDVGCGAGRTAFDEAAGGALVLGIDTNLALLRLARQAQAGTVAYERRSMGLAYDARRFAVVLPGRDGVDFWCCDAAALPFTPVTERVLALNVLDCVPDPAALLRSIAATLVPGGALLLATPFDWAQRATPAAQWVAGPEPLAALLATTGFTVVGQGTHDWHTRLHDRASVRYCSHLVAASRNS